jgi:hypothetical protein
MAKGNWPKLQALCAHNCSNTVDGLKSIVHAPWRKMKIYMSQLNKMRGTNVSSVHVLAKQYYPFVTG